MNTAIFYFNDGTVCGSHGTTQCFLTGLKKRPRRQGLPTESHEVRVHPGQAPSFLSPLQDERLDTKNASCTSGRRPRPPRIMRPSTNIKTSWTADPSPTRPPPVSRHRAASSSFFSVWCQVFLQELLRRSHPSQHSAGNDHFSQGAFAGSRQRLGSSGPNSPGAGFAGFARAGMFFTGDSRVGLASVLKVSLTTSHTQQARLRAHVPSRDKDLASETPCSHSSPLQQLVGTLQLHTGPGRGSRGSLVPAQHQRAHAARLALRATFPPCVTHTLMLRSWNLADAGANTHFFFYSDADLTHRFRASLCPTRAVHLTHRFALAQGARTAETLRWPT